MTAFKRPSPTLLLVLILAATLGLIGTGTARFLRIDREETIKHYERITSDTTRLLEEHARRTIHSADLILLQALRMIRERGGVGAIGSGSDWADFGELAQHLPEQGVLWIYDADGRARLGTPVFPTPPLTVAERDYFQAVKTRGEPFHIGPTIRGKTTGKVFFTVNRPILDEQGRFLGMVQAAIDTAYFTKLYDLLDGSLDPLTGIYRLEGGIVVRRPGMETHLGADVSRGPVFQSLLARAPTGNYESVSPLDGTVRIAAYRRIADLPLVAIAGVSKTAALAEWRARTVRAIWLNLGALGVLIVLGVLTWSSLRRQERTRTLAEAALLTAQASERRACLAGRQAEQAQQRLYEAIECLPDGFALFDAEDRLVLCNSRYRAFYTLPGHVIDGGIRFEDVLRRGAERGLFADAVGRIDAWVAERVAQHRAADRVHEQRLRDGRWLRIDERVTADGGRVGVRVDISEAKRREAELADLVRRNALLAAALEATPNGIAVTDATTDAPLVLYVNRAFEAMTGYTAAEIVGRSIRVLYGSETDPEVAASLHDAKLRGETVTAEMINYRKDGAPFWNMVRLAPVLDPSGSTLAHVAVLWDTTEAHRHEAEELQRQKMEALGQLAGGIAHEINNLLQPVITLSNLNIGAPDLPAPVREDFADILSAGRQCRDVVGAVLAFARKEGAATRPLVLGDAVCRALSFARGVLPPAVIIDSRIGDREAIAMISATELTQVLMNLLTNAADAMDRSGTVTVTLDRLPAAAGLRLTIGDEGCGMDERVRQRLFEPFFTTKPQGKGTGLGLAVVHGIVRGWRGSISVTSAPGRGTSFEITFPMAESPTIEHPATESPPA